VPTPPPTPDNIDKVYIVFSNHLDVGYTDNNNGSCAGSVINRYFVDHFPKAIATAQQMRAQTNMTYKWMTQAWLVEMYRSCNSSTVNINGQPNEPSVLKCPNSTQLAAFEQAVKRGDIGWHAFPFNGEPETFGASMFEAALQLTFRQDQWAGHAKRRTYSQRDVPGLTRAAIPLLVKNGVRAVTVGENGAASPLFLPKILLWKDRQSTTEVIGLFHPHGYGIDSVADGAGSDTDIDDTDIDDSSDFEGEGFHVDSQGKLQMSRDGDCVSVPAAKTALCYAWQGDNQGPHDFKSANSIMQGAQKLFPNAKVLASDAFDDFINDVWAYRDTLPVLDNNEIGDSWIYGE
jgi:hypothetical protein